MNNVICLNLKLKKIPIILLMLIASSLLIFLCYLSNIFIWYKILSILLVLISCIVYITKLMIYPLTKLDILTHTRQIIYWKNTSSSLATIQQINIIHFLMVCITLKEEASMIIISPLNCEIKAYKALIRYARFS